MQAREATASKASPAAAAAVEEQHDEPSGALSHLISMYGASQDEANTASPKGTTNAADALGTVSQPVLTMPAGQGAGDHPVQEGSLQSTKAPSAPSSSEQENDRRGMAGAGGSEVAEQAAQQAQQAQRAEQPPPEVQGIVVKLLAFVKVRLSPLVPLWSRDVQWKSSGALKDDCWRILLAAALRMPV